jgi:hypothetical protein
MLRKILNGQDVIETNLGFHELPDGIMHVSNRVLEKGEIGEAMLF